MSDIDYNITTNKPSISLKKVVNVSSNQPAEAFTSYAVDTSGGSITMALPEPQNGKWVEFTDSTLSFFDNPFTIAQYGGELIANNPNPLTLDGVTHLMLISDGTDWHIF